MKQAIADQPGAYDPKKFLAPARVAVTERVRELIRLCGSDGKA